MGPPLAFLGFHPVFVIPPTVLGGWLAYRREGAMWGHPARSGRAIMSSTSDPNCSASAQSKPRSPCCALVVTRAGRYAI